MKGTVRTFDADLRKLAERRMAEIAAGAATGSGARVEVDWRPGYPATVNHDTETRYAAEVARKIAGAVITDAAPLMAGEDFAYMLERVPGAYIQIGNGDTAEVHHPAYNFNDDAIPAGASYWAELVETRMPAA
jgi:hippurate hydrolase